MIVETLIPLFLAIHIPVEDGTWQHGPEYIFAVHMNMTRTPRCPDYDPSCGEPSGSRVKSRLHCYPTKDNSLVCSLRQVEGYDIGVSEADEHIVNRRKTVTDAPIELLYDDNGIERVIASLRTKPYDLNILKTVVEQLHTGDDFDDIGHGTFLGTAQSTIGKCNVSFNVYRRPSTGNAVRGRRGFLLQPLPEGLRLGHGETLVIDKTMHLDNCSCYAENYYRRISDRVVCENGQADLEHMTSRMEMSVTSFASSTTRTGTVDSDDRTYDVTEVTQVILEDIQPAARDPPVIEKPGQTLIEANYAITKM